MVSLHDTAQFAGIDAVFLEKDIGPLADDPFDIVMGGTEELLHQGLAGVGERAVTDIVEESGSDHERPVFVRKPEAAGCHVCKEHGAERVLEPRVVGAGIHQKGKTELPDIAEALQRQGIKQGECKVLHFYITVDRVLDDFHKFTKESSYTWHKSIE